MTDTGPSPPLSDSFFDRIVEGGLEPARLREALDRLEREPDGWKRCALAFLEAQCWGESFRSIEEAAPAALERESPPTARLMPSPPGRPAGTWRRFAVAAGIAAISFVLGWRVHPDRSPLPAPERPSQLASHDPAAPTGGTRAIDLPDSAEGPSGAAWESEPAPRPAPPIITVGRIRLGPGGGEATVPVIGGPGIDERWVANQPPPMTDHQMALLEQQGYQVDRRRRLLTTTLQDGRRVTVPVDRFQVRYTGIDPL